MRYWDASVLVCLCVEEADTAPARRLVAGGVVTWSVSAVEIASAIERRSRDGSLDASGRTTARLALTERDGRGDRGTIVTIYGSSFRAVGV